MCVCVGEEEEEEEEEEVRGRVRNVMQIMDGKHRSLN